MAVAFDNATGASTDSASSLTFAHTVSGSNRFLVVVVSHRDDSVAVTSVTYNSIAMTASAATVTVNAAGVPDNITTIYYLVAPATGANNVVVTMASSVGGIAAIATSVTGALQINQPVATTSNTGSSSAPSCSITTSTNAFIIDGGVIMRGETWTPTAGQTQNASTINPFGTTAMSMASSRKAATTAGGYTMSWTTGSADLWGSVAIAIQPYGVSQTIVQAGLGADASLTHYWTCDTDFTDSIGGANGTDTNSPTYTSGKFVNAFTAVAASSQYTSVANSIFPWLSNVVWIHLWVKLATTGNNYSLTMTARTAQGILLYISGGTTITFSKPNVVDLNYTWTGIDTNYHMLDFYSNGSGMVMYLDGQPVASNANATVYAAPLTDTITWGAYKSGGSIQAGWYLDGQLDDIAIFTRIPTAAEIFNLYQGGVDPVVTTGNMFFNFL